MLIEGLFAAENALSNAEPGKTPSAALPAFCKLCNIVALMRHATAILSNPSLGLTALAGMALCLYAPLARAQGLIDKPAANAVVMKGFTKPLRLDQRANINYDAYILGPGDGIEIELADLDELSGQFSIGPDGTIYLPRLRALYIEGLTIEELRDFLTEQFRAYVIDPQVYVRPITYRPVRIYVGGEVKRPGYYTLSGDTELTNISSTAEKNQLGGFSDSDNSRPGLGQTPGFANRLSSGDGGISTFGAIFPTVFDAIRRAQGITPYSNLSEVQVTRRRAREKGGGRMRTQLNFLSLLTEGDETQNIRLFDGDVVNVGRSSKVLREQLLLAGQTNLTPQFMQVYVNGQVQDGGPKVLPQGSSLMQAIDLAGGVKVLHGKVEFVRFTREGEIDKRVFRFKKGVPAGDYRNPVLMAGDIINLRQTFLTKSIDLINEITSPAVGIYSTYSLYERFSN